MMINKRISLFSPQAISERQHRGLLIQFILFELFEAHRAHLRQENWEMILSLHPCHFPYDWSSVTGYLNRAQEHGLLLRDSFSDHLKWVKNFEKHFSKALACLSKKKKISTEQFISALQKIYFALEPLIEICKENENLFHFLLKNRKTIDAMICEGYLHSFLLKIHSTDLETLGEKMCDQYHQRGFFSQISEFKILLTELSHV